MSELDLRWLRAQRGAMTGALATLVRCASHTADKRGADAVAALLEPLVPLRCQRVPSTRYGDHLFFGDRAPGAPGVVLVGHHDTVFPEAVFSGWRDDGEHGYGPGALDMKGGLVVIAFALQALARAGRLDPSAITLAVVADEEVGSPESADVLRSFARGADLALVFEAGRAGDAIVTSRKGTGSARAEATGRAAHAGNAHHLGASAVRAMARFIEAAEALTDYARGRTVNVGRVEGGVGKNTVPERCVAEIDLRFSTPEEGRALFEALARCASEAGVSGARVSVSLEAGRSPMVPTPRSEALREVYERAQRAAGLGGGDAGTQGGGSDGCTTSGIGVPTIDGLGPRGEGFHTRDERVSLASLVPKSEALARFLATWRDVPGAAGSVLGSPGE